VNRELNHLKAAVGDLVSGIQRIHQRRRELDDEAAALYRAGRHNGLQIKIVKEVIRDLRGETASADAIWKLYAEKTGIDENAVTDHLSALDRILGV
jgi:uncharacterized protein (UPF0335 family)